MVNYPGKTMPMQVSHILWGLSPLKTWAVVNNIKQSVAVLQTVIKTTWLTGQALSYWSNSRFRICVLLHEVVFN